MSVRVLRGSALALIGALLTVAAYAQQQTAAPGELLGTYTVGHEFGGSALTIEPGGRYRKETGDCTQEYHESGTYILRDGVLVLTVTKSTVTDHDGHNEQDLLNPAVYKELYHEDLTAQDRVRELLPIKWAGRLYLIPKDLLADFCNAINLGLEPRPVLRNSDMLGSPYYGSFFLRDGDEAQVPSNQPALPGDWAGYLLARPVSAEIVSIEHNDKQLVATINRGSKHGLKVGMAVVIGNEQPSPWGGPRIIAVSAESAKVEVHGEVKVGDQLSTRFDRERYLKRYYQ